MNRDCLIGFATSIPRTHRGQSEAPRRCFVNHPFFPWRALPIEVVLSGDRTIRRMLATLRRLGKVPIATADVPCFAADDIFCTYCAEAPPLRTGMANPESTASCTSRQRRTDRST